jgi:hypothetical protein
MYPYPFYPESHYDQGLEDCKLFLTVLESCSLFETIQQIFNRRRKYREIQKEHSKDSYKVQTDFNIITEGKKVHVWPQTEEGKEVQIGDVQSSYANRKRYNTKQNFSYFRMTYRENRKGLMTTMVTNIKGYKEM